MSYVVVLTGDLLLGKAEASRSGRDAAMASSTRDCAKQESLDSYEMATASNQQRWGALPCIHLYRDLASSEKYRSCFELG